MKADKNKFRKRCVINFVTFKHLLINIKGKVNLLIVGY